MFVLYVKSSLSVTGLITGERAGKMTLSREAKKHAREESLAADTQYDGWERRRRVQVMKTCRQSGSSLLNHSSTLILSLKGFENDECSLADFTFELIINKCIYVQLIVFVFFIPPLVFSFVLRYLSPPFFFKTFPASLLCSLYPHVLLYTARLSLWKQLNSSFFIANT